MSQSDETSRAVSSQSPKDPAPPKDEYDTALRERQARRPDRPLQLSLESHKLLSRVLKPKYPPGGKATGRGGTKASGENDSETHEGNEDEDMSRGETKKEQREGREGSRGKGKGTDRECLHDLPPNFYEFTCEHFVMESEVNGLDEFSRSECSSAFGKLARQDGMAEKGLVVRGLRDPLNPVAAFAFLKEDCEKKKKRQYGLFWMGQGNLGGGNAIPIAIYAGTIRHDQTEMKGKSDWATFVAVFHFGYGGVGKSSWDAQKYPWEVRKGVATGRKEKINTEFVIDSTPIAGKAAFINDKRTAPSLLHISHFRKVERKREANCAFRQVWIRGIPHLVVFTLPGRAIQHGEELLADLGETFMSHIDTEVQREKDLEDFEELNWPDIPYKEGSFFVMKGEMGEPAKGAEHHRPLYVGRVMALNPLFYPPGALPSLSPSSAPNCPFLPQTSPAATAASSSVSAPRAASAEPSLSDSSSSSSLGERKREEYADSEQPPAKRRCGERAEKEGANEAEEEVKRKPGGQKQQSACQSAKRRAAAVTTTRKCSRFVSQQARKPLFSAKQTLLTLKKEKKTDPQKQQEKREQDEDEDIKALWRNFPFPPLPNPGPNRNQLKKRALMLLKERKGRGVSAFDPRIVERLIARVLQEEGWDSKTWDKLDEPIDDSLPVEHNELYALARLLYLQQKEYVERRKPVPKYHVIVYWYSFHKWKLDELEESEITPCLVHKQDADEYYALVKDPPETRRPLAGSNRKHARPWLQCLNLNGEMILARNFQMKHKVARLPSTVLPYLAEEFCGDSFFRETEAGRRSQFVSLLDTFRPDFPEDAGERKRSKKLSQLIAERYADGLLGPDSEFEEGGGEDSEEETN
uniref:Uncharacterized protein n=1 Tax=Chromera velia CCMP2878 TaxID=1169474 RepID=A0A0G4HKF3_9ALVE|eukprot:Cvel_7291.t1-p1 / transcript=Cvel_7291.t1 / gene=Cvel_7291 / organism=Chromera_velia_CCMP2878 / gene_product=hypothetical protein / transcript_product=hypothetical protein / location=Cvel_scaffold377:37171-40774(-) / protein_length=863 / sequence_SO=supercontig / SO=protein_coding / is_pseudo=false